MSNRVFSIGFIGESEINEQVETQNEAEAKVQDYKKIEFKPVKISSSRLDKMFNENMKYVLVNNYDDDYHASKEEREKNKHVFEVRRRMGQIQHKYAKLDQYIDAVREVMEIVKLVAKEKANEPATILNSKKSEEEIYYGILSGEIKVPGIYFPEYKGKDRKNRSREYILEYILSDAPSSEIVEDKDVKRRKEDRRKTKEDWEETAKRLFKDNELEEILNFKYNDKQKGSQLVTYEPDEDNLPFDGTAYALTDKEIKAFSKKLTGVYKMTKSNTLMKRNRGAQSALDRLDNFRQFDPFAAGYTSPFDEVAECEKRYKKNDGIESNETIDLLNDKEYNKLINKLDEYYLHECSYYDNNHNSTRSIYEDNMDEFYTDLEKMGYNVRKLNSGDLKLTNAEKHKKAMKENKKRKKYLEQKRIDIVSRLEAAQGVSYRDVSSAGGKQVVFDNSKKGKKKHSKLVKKRKKDLTKEIKRKSKKAKKKNKKKKNISNVPTFSLSNGITMGGF